MNFIPLRANEFIDPILNYALLLFNFKEKILTEMLLRYIILSTFIFSILILLHREKVNHSDPIHHPPQNVNF